MMRSRRALLRQVLLLPARDVVWGLFEFSAVRPNGYSAPASGGDPSASLLWP